MLSTAFRQMIVAVGATVVAGGQQDLALPKDAQSLTDHIASAGATEKMSAIEGSLGSFKETLNDPALYASMVESACQSLRDDGRALSSHAENVEQKYVVSALDRPDMIPTLLEARLVLRLRVNIPAGAVLVKDEIRSKVELLFHAWRRIELDTNPAFNFADFPLENVAPPRGSGAVVFSGMDPSSIADPRQRESYIAAVEKNRAKAAEYSRQIGLQRIRKPFLLQTEALLSAALDAHAITAGEVLSNLAGVRNDADRERVVGVIRSRDQQ